MSTRNLEDEMTKDSRYVSSGGGVRGTGPGSGSKAGEPTIVPAPKRSLLKSKKFLIAVVVVLALGGGAYTFLKPSKAGPPTGGEVVPMDATTLNLQAGHYLKIAVAIQLTKGKASATDFSTSHAAELVIDEFSNRTVSALASNTARKKLTADLLGSIQKAYPGAVYDIFLTQFVTQ
ncbi:MAG: flagellar basal body-associated FliL family protein [Sciscionella sp.]